MAQELGKRTRAGNANRYVVARIVSFVPEETFAHEVGHLFFFFGRIIHLRKKPLINDCSVLRQFTSLIRAARSV